MKENKKYDLEDRLIDFAVAVMGTLNPLIISCILLVLWNYHIHISQVSFL